MLQRLALIFGLGFIITGLLAFIENPVIGKGGLFDTNNVLNVIYLFSGFVFLIMSYQKETRVSLGLTIGGVFYLVLGLLGLLLPGDVLMGLIRGNILVNILHLLLGMTFMVAGLGTRSYRA